MLIWFFPSSTGVTTLDLASWHWGEGETNTTNINTTKSDGTLTASTHTKWDVTTELLGTAVAGDMLSFGFAKQSGANVQGFGCAVRVTPV